MDVENVWEDRMLNEVMALMVLTIFSIEDIRTKRIKTMPLVISFVLGVLLQIVTNGNSIQEMMLGAAVGGVLLVISKCSKEAIGYGDSLIFLVMGIYLGMNENLRLLFFSLVTASVFSAICLIVKKKNTKDEIVFVPFIWLAELIHIGGLCV